MKILVVAAAVLLVLSSCQQAPVDENLSVQVPWQSSDGEYGLNDVKLSGIKSLDPFYGDFAIFTVSPKLSPQAMVGPSASVQVVDHGGKLVPRDDVSSEVLTIYAHYERLFALDKKVGAEGVLKYPRRVGLRVFVRGGGVSSDNALYYEPLDIMFIVPYKRGQLPLAFNGGVLAHEHFHSLFNKYVMGGLRTKYGLNESDWLHVHGVKPTPQEVESYSKDFHRYFNDTLLRGMNEGFADFWGWLYSRDSNFIEKSLKEGAYRRLDGKQMRFPSVKQMSMKMLANIELREHADSEGDISYAYAELAARYSRFLFRMSKALGEDGKYIVARNLLEVLPSLQGDILQVYKTNSLSPLMAIARLVEKTEEKKKEVCELYLDSMARTDLSAMLDGAEEAATIPFPSSCLKALEVAQ